LEPRFARGVRSLFDTPTCCLLGLVVLENIAVGPTTETLGLTRARATQRLT
jgi:hypothetical protein